jgi:probable rRNA maturation factor
MAQSTLRVLVSDERGRRVASSTILTWLLRVAPPRARGVVNIALVSDARMRELNRTYRHQDKATDVLSFPAAEEGVLGDIAIARGVASRQAVRAGHPYTTELRILALHGLLHLLGYDHEHDDGRMRKVEAELLRKGGIYEGLIDRRDSA